MNQNYLNSTLCLKNSFESSHFIYFIYDNIYDNIQYMIIYMIIEYNNFVLFAEKIHNFCSKFETIFLFFLQFLKMKSLFQHFGALTFFPMVKNLFLCNFLFILRKLNVFIKTAFSINGLEKYQNLDLFYEFLKLSLDQILFRKNRSN